MALSVPRVLWNGIGNNEVRSRERVGDDPAAAEGLIQRLVLRSREMNPWSRHLETTVSLKLIYRVRQQVINYVM